MIGKSSFKGFFCTFEEKMSPSVGANSLDVFISSLDEELEIGAATQFSKFFTLKKRLWPKSIIFLLFFRHHHSTFHCRDLLGQKLCQISPLHEGKFNKTEEDSIPNLKAKKVIIKAVSVSPHRFKWVVHINVSPGVSEYGAAPDVQPDTLAILFLQRGEAKQV